MRELGLLLLVLAAVSAGGSSTGSGCRAPARNTGEAGLCGSPQARDARMVPNDAIPVVPAKPAPPVSLPPEGWTRVSKPAGTVDPESVSKVRRD